MDISSGEVRHATNNKAGEVADTPTFWKQIYPNEHSMNKGILLGSSTNCTFKKIFRGMRRGTFMLRLRVYEVGSEDFENVHSAENDDLIVDQKFFEFDLESFSSCEVSKRLPQIHFSNSFIDLDSRNNIFDVVKMTHVTREGAEQSTIVFSKREGENAS